jgi:hypothetical protein
LAERWILVFYRAPSEPSSTRVSAWRRLHRLGALYVGPSACLIPVRLQPEASLADIGLDLRNAGGDLEAYRVEAFAEEAEAALEARYNAARDEEYAELVERAQGVVDELKREGANGKFTFAEVDENEADLVKLRRWHRRIRARDLFQAPGQLAAKAAIDAAEALLENFVQIASAREDQSLIRLPEASAKQAADQSAVPKP